MTFFCFIHTLSKGTVLKGEELAALSQGLSTNHLIDYDYLLTGYIGSKSFLEEVLNLLNMLEESKPIVKYLISLFFHLYRIFN